MGKYDFELDVFDENTISWIASRVENNSCVLEFGPANGRLTRYLKEQKQCKVDIVEIDSESGKVAAQYAERAYIGAENGDIEKYYWLQAERKYDVVIFADVLEHLINPGEVVKRCKSVVNKNGLLLVSIPNVSHNSVIIELLNDRFDYNSTGILDNTHLRFFTRQSFERMVLDAGWAIVEEKVKNIRVGETEIKNSYNDIPKSIFKELAHRPQGNIYQYMFVLSLSEEYLLGKYERVVSMDSTSYYYAEVQYEVNGNFDYRQSISKHYDPYYRYIDLKFDVLNGSLRALVKPINVDCMLENIQIFAQKGESMEQVSIGDINGTKIQQKKYLFDNPPEIKVDLPLETDYILFKAHVLMYDLDEEQKQFLQMLKSECILRDKEVLEKENKIFELNNIIQEKETQIQEKEHVLKIQSDDLWKKEQEIEQLTRTLRDKELEFSKSIEIYENEVNRREKERNELLEKINEKNRFLRFLQRKRKQGEIFINRVQQKKVITGNAAPMVEQVHEKLRTVTAVIPNYNYARYMNERIDSIISQTYPVSEIIILDDCSSDNSIEVINKRIAENNSGIPMRLVVNENNSGSVFAQWQKAFQLATGEFVWIAEADDSCNEKFLETIMAGFDDQDVVISYCESLTMDENNVLLMGDLRVWIDIFNTGKWDNDYVKDGKEEVAETMCINNTIANVSSAVIKKGDYYNILEEAKSYKLAGDWYTYMNILKLGKIAYFKESLNYHRMQKQGLTLSTSHEKEFEEIVRLQDFALENFDVSEEVRNKVYERRERERVRFGL